MRLLSRSVPALYRYALPLVLALASSAVIAREPVSARSVIAISVRVHLVRSSTDDSMQTTLTVADIRRIFDKVNRVWSQAGIRLEIESVVETQAAALLPIDDVPEQVRIKTAIPQAALSRTAVDVCYVKSIRPNGFYYGEPIVVKDTAELREVPGGLDEPLPRVTSHEIGHALGLNHRQDVVNLMASGTTGFELNEAEIQIARDAAGKYPEK